MPPGQRRSGLHRGEAIVMSAENQPVRWGILGTARIAERVVAAIHQAHNAEVVAVASRSRDRAQRWAAKHHVPNAYGSYERIIQADEVDAVYIPLPPSLHAEWTVRSAESGKHVLCEKPLAVGVSETHEMAHACREHNVQLMDGVMWVHHPRAVAMKQVIADGSLGPLRRVTSAFTFHREFPANDLRMQRALGGGALLDLGWYCVGATLWAFEELPNYVSGSARYTRDVDINFSAMLWFDGSRCASFDCGFDTGMRRWMEIAGTSGSLVCDDFTRPWDETRARFWVHGSAGKVDEHQSEPRIQEVCMIEHFSQIVRNQQPEDHWAEHAIRIQTVCSALDESARTGRVVAVK